MGSQKATSTEGVPLNRYRQILCSSGAAQKYQIAISYNVLKVNTVGKLRLAKKEIYQDINIKRIGAVIGRYAINNERTLHINVEIFQLYHNAYDIKKVTSIRGDSVPEYHYNNSKLKRKQKCLNV